jgi:hypothetical protein
MKNKTIVLQAFNDEMSKIAVNVNVLGGLGNVVRGGINAMKSGTSNFLHGSNPIMNKAGKIPLRPPLKTATNIGKGVLGGAALATGIAGAGTLWGGLTTQPGMNAYMSGEGPSAQGPIYGV